MNAKPVVLIGSTGLIGSHLLELLQNDSEIASIKALVRRSVAFDHPKVKAVVIDFSDLDSFRTELEGSDIVFCAIGTTNKKVKGDKEAYRKVDYDIPVHAATFSAEAGCSQFLLVSSLGADSNSNNFYLKLKGEVEEAISSLDIPTVLFFRPSILLGKRDEFRLGELIGKFLTKSISFLLPSRMRPAPAHLVAQAMLAAAKKELKGSRVFHYETMKQLVDKG